MMIMTTNELKYDNRACFQITRETGQWQSVEYSTFTLGSEADKYRLNVAGFSGDAGDAFSAPVHPFRVVNGMQFSTGDSDNDNNGGQCFGGTTGWWFNNCGRSTLNAYYRADWNTVTDTLVTNIEFVRMLVKLDD